MNYQDCVEYLIQLGHELRTVKFGLEPTSTILAALGHPEQQYATAIVSGTNGKGSTSAMLSSILEAAGYRTGLYTSPHLVRLNERIRLNKTEISDEEFARAFTEVREVVTTLLSANTIPREASFFEYVSVTALLYFARAKAQIVVLEVGMGGRLDATNTTNPAVAIVTNVTFDHMEYLGSTIPAIAWEKAGVIKPKCRVVSSVEDTEAVEVIRQRCAELEADLLETSRFSRLSNLQSRNGRFTFDLVLDDQRFTSLTVPLAGRFQVTNAVTALTAAWRLAQVGYAISRAAMVSGLRLARWPGRLETFAERPLVLLDGAHNPAAAHAMAAFVKEQLTGRTIRLVYASMRDKAIGEISEILFPLASEVFLTRPDQPRAATAQEILQAAKCPPAKFIIEPDPARALQAAYENSGPDDVVLACGSLFLVGALKQAVAEGKLELGHPHYAAKAVDP